MSEQLRSEAKAALSQYGFPTRLNEDWKYTRTDALLKHDFALNTADIDDSIRLQNIPEGALVLPLHQALTTHADLVLPHLGKILKMTHGFHAQNLAFFNTGYFIYLPEGLKATKPLYIYHTAKAADKMQCIRHLIVAEASSALKVVEVYDSALDTLYFTNTMTEVALGVDACVTHVKVQQEGEMAYHVGEVSAKQAKRSQFESHSFSVGADWARSDTSVLLAEEDATCLMNGVYLPKAKQHIDHHTTIEHIVPNCTSEQDYKGILHDESSAVFNGKVLVLAGASNTKARQYNKNVLCSSGALVNTKPELQIFTDDVTCAHGATVGQLDEDALFYLATRGIDTALAERYLMQAFLSDNFKKMLAVETDGPLSQLIKQHME